jgi:Fur family ferric uptake transcriptional regulator
MKSETRKSIDSLLGSVKLRRTDQRRTILDILLNAKGPRTADEIMATMIRKSANKVTVYRTLESMVATGLVHKAFVHKRAEHFELANRCTDVQCHPHFTCTNCGETFCLTDTFLPLIKGLKKGFVVHRQRVGIEGLCSSCS